MIKDLKNGDLVKLQLSGDSGILGKSIYVAKGRNTKNRPAETLELEPGIIAVFIDFGIESISYSGRACNILINNKICWVWECEIIKLT